MILWGALEGSTAYGGPLRRLQVRKRAVQMQRASEYCRAKARARARRGLMGRRRHTQQARRMRERVGEERRGVEGGDSRGVERQACGEEAEGAGRVEVAMLLEGAWRKRRGCSALGFPGERKRKGGEGWAGRPPLLLFPTAHARTPQTLAHRRSEGQGQCGRRTVESVWTVDGGLWHASRLALHPRPRPRQREAEAEREKGVVKARHGQGWVGSRGAGEQGSMGMGMVPVV